MDDILDIIRDRSKYYKPTNEGVSPKESPSRKTIIFKRIYKKSDFMKMLKSIKSVYDKDVYEEINKIKNDEGIKFVYPFDIDIKDLNLNEIYELIIDVVDLPLASEDNVKSIMYNALSKFRKIGLPFEIDSGDGKLYYRSKVVIQVV